MSAVKRAIQARLHYLRRELEIAERDSTREPLDVSMLPRDQRKPFDAVNREIEQARAVIPIIRAEIAELEAHE